MISIINMPLVHIVHIVHSVHIVHIVHSAYSAYSDIVYQTCLNLGYIMFMRADKIG